MPSVHATVTSTWRPGAAVRAPPAGRTTERGRRGPRRAWRGGFGWKLALAETPLDLLGRSREREVGGADTDADREVVLLDLGLAHGQRLAERELPLDLGHLVVGDEGGAHAAVGLALGAKPLDPDAREHGVDEGEDGDRRHHLEQREPDPARGVALTSRHRHPDRLLQRLHLDGDGVAALVAGQDDPRGVGGAVALEAHGHLAPIHRALGRIDSREHEVVLERARPAC